MPTLTTPLVAARLTALCTAVLAPFASAQATAWTDLLVNGPQPVAWTSMAFDAARGRTVLFGGAYSLFSFGETWEWDGAAWAQVATSGPAARSGAAMAFDAGRRVTVLFGGGSGFANYGDTWEWNGAAWSLRASAGPPIRTGHAMAFDAGRGVCVMFGGVDADVWEWDGRVWAQRVVPGPSIRADHAMAFDGVRGETVLFGGRAAGGVAQGDTWVWNGANWRLAATAGPSARFGHAMAFDSQRGVTILTCGTDAGGGVLGDTWEWDGVVWTRVLGLGPTERTAGALVFDSARGRAVLFGGNDGSVFAPRPGTWAYGTGLASAIAYGQGCGGLGLYGVPGRRPVLGANAEALITGVPAGSPAFVAAGFRNDVSMLGPLPLALDRYGLTGCQMLQSNDVIDGRTTPNSPTVAVMTFAVPSLPALVGLRLYLQAWAPAPAQPGGFVVSNGLAWGLGVP